MLCKCHYISDQFARLSTVFCAKCCNVAITYNSIRQLISFIFIINITFIIHLLIKMSLFMVTVQRNQWVFVLFQRVCACSLIPFDPHPPPYPIRCINQVQDQDRPLSHVSPSDFTVPWFLAETGDILGGHEICLFSWNRT